MHQRNLKNSGRLVKSSLLAGIAYILTGVAEACTQLELISILNSNGVVTDENTTQDEINVMFGSDWKDA